MPNSTRMPSTEKMFSDWPKISSDSRANGKVSGSASKMVNGWIHDSNCAARIKYMKMNAMPNAVTKATPAFFSSLERPVGPVSYSGPRPCFFTIASMASTI